jgi:alpha/beta superfamily hydrolase
MAEFFPGPVGQLECKLWLPHDDEPEPARPPVRVACVMCHPHPSHGGTMDNSVVFRTARGMQRAGVAVLRFNFRGVGASEGSYDGEGGEEDDVRAALDQLESLFPSAVLWAGGFSFGSRQVCGVSGREQRIRRLVLVALPVLAYECQAAGELDRPGLLLMAGDDDFGTLSAALERFPNLEALEGQEVAGADHFFRDHLELLEEIVHNYATRSVRST